MAEDVTIASTMSIATTPQKSVGSPPTSTKDACTMKDKTDFVTARRYVSAMVRPSHVRPCPMETRTYMQSSMRKLLQLLTARKGRIST
eukprot:11866978-Ditylum_brightwellii.AAC.1